MEEEEVELTPNEVGTLLHLVARRLAYEERRKTEVPDIQGAKITRLQSLREKLERMRLSA
jgi:hypothetical protein